MEELSIFCYCGFYPMKTLCKPSSLTWRWIYKVPHPSLTLLDCYGKLESSMGLECGTSLQSS